MGIGRSGYYPPAKEFRLRSGKYLKYIRSKPCLICGLPASEAHHLMRAQVRGMSLKVGDQWCVPICHAHHMQLHEFAGGERSFWAVNGIRPEVWAAQTYAEWKEEDERI